MISSDNSDRPAAIGGSDPRCRPVTLNGPVPIGGAIPYPRYTAEDHETWSLLFGRQRELLERRACDEYLDGLRVMDFDARRIPALARANDALQATTGWSIARIPGLLQERDFFAFLARRTFPSTDYIRARHEMDYTPAPDLFHDLFGHTPLITNPTFAELYRRIGEVALAARGPDRRRVERFYWFTVEFGLIRTDRGLRAYGNGILSSRAEILHGLGGAVEKRPFDIDAVVEQEYDIWRLQPLLFVIESFEQLAGEFERWARRRGLG